MCDTAMSNQAKKHTWNGKVVQTQDDRLSPSRESLDSGFGSFPASPNSSTNADGPPALTKCCDYFNSQADTPPTLVNCSVYESDDEPVFKMPRLFAIGEEEDEEDEISQPTSPISPPLSVPEKEVEEPKPETASIPVESTTTLKKRVRITTPEEVDENVDLYEKYSKPQHPCLWANCSDEFFDVNDLYDHTMEQHFHALRPSTSSLPSTSTAQRRMAVRDDKEELASEKKYRCQWGDCEQSLRRGAADKKFNWLKNHFRTKHTPKAQPLRCLINGCPIRFQHEKALTTHLLNSHDDKPVRKPQQPATKTVSCFDYELPVRTETYGAHDFFDKHTFCLISEKVRNFYAQPDQPIEPTVKPLDDGVPCMTTKKTLKVLRKLFKERMTHAKCH